MKQFLQMILEGYVRRYFRAHPEVKLVVVAGSVGKTSTKQAIATVLSERFRVRMHEGNHNSELSAPLAMLGVAYPSQITHPLQWLRVMVEMRRRVHQPADVDVIVQELGTDRIGQIPAFGRYLKPDIAVVTAVAPEHMEYFKTMQAVAEEELAVTSYSALSFINRDDIDGEFAQLLRTAAIRTYGTTPQAEYRVEVTSETAEGRALIVRTPRDDVAVQGQVRLAGDHALRAVAVATGVALELGVTPDEIARSFPKLKAVAGRMNILRGQRSSIIIDDTYNASPLAVQAALRTLYGYNAPQRIAVLGSMNELGEMSADAHRDIGEWCDPSLLAHVVTVGQEANTYLAPAARAKGCHVESFETALAAGAYVHSVLEPGAVVLLKGSQGGIYLEEAVKVLLHSTDDEAQLVRQSDSWLRTKQAFFAEHGMK